MSAAPATATPTDLSQLENAGEFIARHIGVTPDDERKMLAVIGEPSRQALIDAIVPRSIARSDDMALPPVATEAAALAEPGVAAHLQGQTVRKVIVVPGRIVNIVAG